MKTLLIEGKGKDVNIVFDGLPSTRAMIKVMEEHMLGSDLTNKDFVELFEAKGNSLTTTCGLYSVSLYNTLIRNCSTGDVKEKVNYR